MPKPKMPAGATLDDLTIAELAVAAQVDPRSIRKALRGERVKGLAGGRIARVFADRRIAV